MDDWLKYNASEYTVNGKTYRNLEAQVLKNKEDIENLDISGIEDDIEALQDEVAGKQDELTPGNNITISEENVISATDTTYTPGSGISISAENEISSTVQGIPSGGTTGQALCKTSGTDYDVSWQTVGGGGGSTKYHTFDSKFIQYRNGMAYVASLSGTDTAQTLYEEFDAGNVVALIDSAGIVAFVNHASESGGVYYIKIHGYGSYFDYTPPVEFYGAVDSGSQSFTETVYFDLNTDKWVTRTITLAAADWVSGGGGTYIDQQVACTSMTATATVWISPVPTQAYTEDYAQYKIICTAQSAGYLTFTSYQTTVPTNDISVNVVFKR